MAIYNLAIAVMLLPLLGALSSFLAETYRRAAQICLFFTLLSAGVGVFLLGWRFGHPHDGVLDNVYAFWAFDPSGGATPAIANPGLERFQPQIGVHVDSLSLVFMPLIAVVGGLTQWHSMLSSRGDPEYRRIFWLTSSLIASLLALAVSASLFQMLLMWGVSGALSWMLMTHWWQQKAHVVAARRSFIVNRIGDLALLLSCVLVFVKFGSNALQQPPPSGQTVTDPLAFTTLSHEVGLAVNGQIAGVGMRTLAIIGVLCAIAALIRLAQLPFHIWLLDSEDAPLPAMLLAAALLPLSGGLLLARVYPLMLAVPHLLGVIAVAGALTALVAAAMALVQTDMARLVLTLAVAQLGLVTACLGVGGFSNSLQMMATYSAFTVALFLAAANMVRAYRTRDIYEMGGAWHKMRKSSLVMGAWVAATAGLNLMSYTVISALLRNSLPNGGAVTRFVEVITVVLVVLATTLLSAAAARLWLRVCTGELRKRRGIQVERIAEVAGAMWRSAAAAVVVGFGIVAMGFPAVSVTFSHFVFFGDHRQELPVVGWAVALALLGGLVGLALGAAIPRHRPALEAGPLAVRWLAQGAYAQTGLPAAAAWCGQRLGDLAVRSDVELTDRFFGGVGEGYQLLEDAAGQARTRRLPAYIASGVAVGALIAVATCLYATGHFPRLGA